MQCEECSLLRATSFNKHRVSKFYEKPEDAVSRNENFAKVFFCGDSMKLDRRL
jgi:hypothetical protein